MAHSAPSVDLVLDELEEGNNKFVLALDPEALELEHEFFVFSSSNYFNEYYKTFNK